MLVTLGFLAIAAPWIVSVAVAVLLGWIFLVSGLVGLVTTVCARHVPGVSWSLLSAFLGILIGGILVSLPIGGVVPLIYVLIAFFVIEGIATIMISLAYKRQLSARWQLLLVSGIADFVFAGLIFIGAPGAAFWIFIGLPDSSIWAVGVLVGINILLGGSLLIAMALLVRADNSNPKPGVGSANDC